MNAHGRVACLDAATGKELWAVNVLERFEGRNITWAMSECLLVDGPRLIVTPGGRKALMAALDKRNGQTIWTAEPLPGDRVRMLRRFCFVTPDAAFRRIARRATASASMPTRASCFGPCRYGTIRHEHHHARLRRRQYLLRDSIRFWNMLPVAAGIRIPAEKPGRPRWTVAQARCFWSTARSTAAVTRSTSRGSAWIGSPGRCGTSSKG